MPRIRLRAFRFLALFAGLIFLGAGTAALLPHTHEGDFTHSSHSDCPFYRIASQGVDSPASFSALFFFTFFAEPRSPSSREAPEEVLFEAFSNRAPPLPASR